MKLKFPKITNRRFLGAAAFAAAPTCFYPWRIEPHWVELVRRQLPIEKLLPMTGAQKFYRLTKP